jgi:sugar fermentation stimulation protein A
MLVHRLYETWSEARYVDRPNRFTLLLEGGGRLFKAYLPTTGRLEELLTDGSIFFVSPSQTARFTCRVVSTLYQGNYVLLDAVKMNALVGTLLRRGLLPHFGPGWSHGRGTVILTEKAQGSMRVDFTIEPRCGGKTLLEVKSCTLCHNGTALFPDAPSRRALRQLEQLAASKDAGLDPALLFIIPNGSATRFIPNVHTDYDFSLRMLSEKRIRFTAARVRCVDPVSVDLESVAEVPIACEDAQRTCTGSGSYLLVLKNRFPARIRVGKLGEVPFRDGYYVYAGSALRSLEGRVKRHTRCRKKTFWHIDYITPHPMSVVKTFLFRRPDRIESALAGRLRRCSQHPIDGFGSSDSGERSHLFYFPDPPHRRRAFMDIVMDFKTFTE